MDGRVEERFAAVGKLFAELIDSGAESGASLAVWHDGRLVVDLVGGWRDAGRLHPWTADTLVNVYSVSKPFAALCLLMLVDRGRVGLDDPVREHWPEFRSGSTVRQVLAHTAGLPVFPVPRPTAAFGDWALLTGDLAAAEPLWTPGSVAAEHAMTYGHLVGELVRRVDGRTVGRFLAEEVAGPWRLDLAFGLSEADQRRCADVGYGDPDWLATTLGEPGSLRERAVGNPSGGLDPAVVNSPLWRAAEVPAVNLHATATGIARCYAGLLAGGTLDGVRLLGADAVAELLRVQYDGPDLMLDRPVRWSLGMQIDDGEWGMGGIGGNVGFADPVHNFTFGYATRHLSDFARVDALAEAVTTALQPPR